MKLRKHKPYTGFLADVRALYGPQTFINGPYIRRSDNRRIVILRGPGLKTTKLYAKVKLEIKLGRRLSRFDTVDHKDGNNRNDRFSNLGLLSLRKNAQKAAIRNHVPLVRCLLCKTKFKPTLEQFNSRSRKKAGPFCSKSCSGKYGASVLHGSARLGRKHVQVKKYHLNNKGQRTYLGE